MGPGINTFGKPRYNDILGLEPLYNCIRIFAVPAAEQFLAPTIPTPFSFNKQTLP